MINSVQPVNMMKQNDNKNVIFLKRKKNQKKCINRFDYIRLYFTDLNIIGNILKRLFTGFRLLSYLNRGTDPVRCYTLVTSFQVVQGDLLEGRVVHSVVRQLLFVQQFALLLQQTTISQLVPGGQSQSGDHHQRSVDGQYVHLFAKEYPLGQKPVHDIDRSNQTDDAGLFHLQGHREQRLSSHAGQSVGQQKNRFVQAGRSAQLWIVSGNVQHPGKPTAEHETAAAKPKDDDLIVTNCNWKMTMMMMMDN